MLLGDHDQGLDLMNRAMASGAMPIFYKDEPVWDPVRTDPRFVAILRRMGVPD